MHAPVLLQRQVQLVLHQTIDKDVVMLISRQTHACVYHACTIRSLSAAADHQQSCCKTDQQENSCIHHACSYSFVLQVRLSPDTICVLSFIHCAFLLRQLHTVLSSSLQEVCVWQSAEILQCGSIATKRQAGASTTAATLQACKQ